MPSSDAQAQSPEVGRLVDRYHALADEIRRLEAKRELAKADLLIALALSPGVHRGATGAVRTGVLATARFEHAPVVERLARARLLTEAARIQPIRLRQLLDTRADFEAAVGSVVRRVDLPYLTAMPGVPGRGG